MSKEIFHAVSQVRMRAGNCRTDGGYRPLGTHVASMSKHIVVACHRCRRGCSTTAVECGMPPSTDSRYRQSWSSSLLGSSEGNVFSDTRFGTFGLIFKNRSHESRAGRARIELPAGDVPNTMILSKGRCKLSTSSILAHPLELPVLLTAREGLGS